VKTTTTRKTRTERSAPFVEKNTRKLIKFSTLEGSLLYYLLLMYLSSL
jgi:hypothetical protein